MLAFGSKSVIYARRGPRRILADLREIHSIKTNTHHDKWIGRAGRIAWPACSSDVNPLDFCLLGPFKNHSVLAQIENEQVLHRRIFTPSHHSQLPWDGDLKG